MDRDIKVVVRDKVAKAVGDPVIICGNSDYTITFSFDDEWAGVEVKTARFKFLTADGIKHKDAPFTGDKVEVPALFNIREVKVGVYAGDLSTTTGAPIRCKPGIRCGADKEAEPDPDKYDQLMELINGGVLKGQSAYEAAKAGGYEGTEEEFQKALADIASGSTGGGIVEELDPTVPDWAKNPEKPKYKASEIAYQNKDLDADIDNLKDGLDTAVAFVTTRLPEIESALEEALAKRPTAQTDALDWMGFCVFDNSVLYISDTWGQAPEVPLGAQIKAIEILPEGQDAWLDLFRMHEVDGLPYSVNMSNTFIDGNGYQCYAVIFFSNGLNFFAQALDGYQTGSIRITYYTD